MIPDEYRAQHAASMAALQAQSQRLANPAPPLDGLTDVTVPDGVDRYRTVRVPAVVAAYIEELENEVIAWAKIKVFGR